jgi:hypothetical protein
VPQQDDAPAAFHPPASLAGVSFLVGRRGMESARIS